GGVSIREGGRSRRAAGVPPVKLIVLGAVVVSVPPHVVDEPFATVNPGGSVSVKLIPVRLSEAFGFVIVNVRLVVPPTRMLAAPNDFVNVGALATVTVAVLLVAPVPPLVDVTAPVVLFLTPAVAPVTVTVKLHVPLDAMDAPVSVIVLGFVVVRVPPQVAVGPEVATVNPAGSVSVNPTPVNPTVEFGLVIVKVRLVVPPSGIFGTPNALLIIGGATTVIDALAVPPVPPSVDVIFPLVLFLTPAVVPVTSTRTVHVPVAAIVPPLNVSVVSPAFGVNVPPHAVFAFGVAATCKPAGSESVNATPVSAVVVLLFVRVNSNVAVPFSGTVETIPVAVPPPDAASPAPAV